jgi:uncharacterized membrane protein
MTKVRLKKYILSKTNSSVGAKITEITQMRQNTSFSTLIFIIIFGVGAILSYVINGFAGNLAAGSIGVGTFVLAC